MTLYRALNPSELSWRTNKSAPITILSMEETCTG